MPQAHTAAYFLQLERSIDLRDQPFGGPGRFGFGAQFAEPVFSRSEIALVPTYAVVFGLRDFERLTLVTTKGRLENEVLAPDLAQVVATRHRHPDFFRDGLIGTVVTQQEFAHAQRVALLQMCRRDGGRLDVTAIDQPTDATSVALGIQMTLAVFPFGLDFQLLRRVRARPKRCGHGIAKRRLARTVRSDHDVDPGRQTVDRKRRIDARHAF